MCELRKLIKNKLLYIVLFISICIVLVNAIIGSIQYNTEYDLYNRLYSKFPDALAMISPHQYWMGLSDSFFSSFFYFIFPLLIGLPIVDSIFREKSSGNVEYILTKESRLRYYSRKFIFTYFSGVILFAFPLLIGILISNLVNGQWDFSAYTDVYKKVMNGTASFADNVFDGQKKEMFSDLLAKSPYLYICIYYLIAALYAGMYACFGLAISLFLKNRYIVLLSPLMLYLGFWLLCSLIGKVSIDPFNFLDPRQPVHNLSYSSFYINFIIGMLTIVIIYILGVKKNSDTI
ncbi:ABC transporter permease [Bacillus sp. FSL K6-4563]|uniref:ABC transporter permease n=1 Tax=Bacillus TaxID=1386 RepID=UPI00017A5DF3|nr:ABC transporter permease [Bacillus pumilus]EDW23445.1 NADH dehydrogenase [Bacillus pumilus ATCC 7061]MCR4354520.1 ABC transporter permease [Bacillus pumilus]MCY7506859.1 ABC transporter permease [Bacillus pumilus]MDR4270674.1 NADH dehydrogenase FAD-containing subunit [Bacillus pumilus]MED4630778.1 ABC transporter permease [Bacillus pumilus]